MSDDPVPAPVVVEGGPVAPRNKYANLKSFYPGDPRINRKGRINHAKNSITQAFVKDLQKWHAQHGMKAIEKVGREQPAILLQIIAAMVPKQVEVTNEHTGSVAIVPVSVQEIERRNRELLARIIDADAEGLGAG